MRAAKIYIALRWFAGLAFIVAALALIGCAYLQTTEHRIAAAWLAQEQAAKLITTLSTAKTPSGLPLVAKADLQKAQDCLSASSALLTKAEKYFRDGAGDAGEARSALKTGAKSIDIILDVLAVVSSSGKFDLSCKALAEVT